MEADNKRYDPGGTDWFEHIRSASALMQQAEVVVESCEPQTSEADSSDGV